MKKITKILLPILPVVTATCLVPLTCCNKDENKFTMKIAQRVGKQVELQSNEKIKLEADCSYYMFIPDDLFSSSETFNKFTVSCYTTGVTFYVLDLYSSNSGYLEGITLKEPIDTITLKCQSTYNLNSHKFIFKPSQVINEKVCMKIICE